MAATLTPPAPTAAGTGYELFLRLWDRQRLTPALARHLEKLEFPPEDLARMVELTRRHRAGGISPAEAAELDEFLQVAGVLSVLRLRARAFLKKHAARG